MGRASKNLSRQTGETVEVLGGVLVEAGGVRANGPNICQYNIPVEIGVGLTWVVRAS